VKKAVAAGLAVVAVAAAGLGIGLNDAADPRANAQTPVKPAADDLKTRRDALDAELQESKAQVRVAQFRLLALEARKKELDDAIRRQAEEGKKGQTEPYVLVLIEDGADQGSILIRIAEYTKEAGEAVPGLVGTVTTSDIPYLRTYLERIRKDPAAPKKLLLRDASRTTNFMAEVGRREIALTCAAVKFPVFEHVPPPPSAPRAKPTVKGFREGAPPPYTIEPPDMLKIDAYVRFIPADAPVDPNGVLRELPVKSVVTGNHLVRPDGTVSLGQYGEVSVAGMTIPEATAAIRKHLAGQNIYRREAGTSESLVVVVDVVAFNSKVYYVITDGDGTGEQVFRLPCTGNETVLDAVAQINGLPAGAEGGITLARPSSGGTWTRDVDWTGITKHGKTETNYQILPGDRIYVKKKPAAANGP